MKRTWLLLSVLLVALVMLGVVSCDKRSVNEPNYVLQEIMASPDSIYSDSNSETYTSIKARVTDGRDNPATGVTVNFAADKGAVTASATTDDTGWATVTFDDNGAAPGTATIEASINTRTSLQTTVRILEQPTYHIVSFAPAAPSVNADNDDQTYTELEVIVHDNLNNPVSGQSVSFVIVPGYTQYASLSATSAETNSLGQATVNFLDKGIVADSVLVRAILGTQQMTCKVKIENLPYRISNLQASPATLSADNDTSTNSTVTATVLDEDNHPVSSQTVNFWLDTTASGTITGTATTDDAGVATATFSDNGIPGTVTVYARIGASTVSTPITVQPATQYHIQQISALPNVIYADNDAATYSTVEVLVYNGDSIPADSSSVQVQFWLTYNGSSISLGNVTPTAYTNSFGIAQARVYDVGYPGTITVNARIVNTNTVVTTDVTIASLTSYRLVENSIVANPSTTYADNDANTYSEVQISVVDNLGYPAAEQNVNFWLDSNSTSLGSIVGTVATDEFGVARARFTDNGTIGTAVVHARLVSGNAEQTTNVQIVALPSYYIQSVTPNPSQIYADNDLATYSMLTIKVNNNGHVAAPGQTVNFSLSSTDSQYAKLTDANGNVVTSGVTDDNGEVTVRLQDKGELALNNQGVATTTPVTVHATLSGSADDYTCTVSILPITNNRITTITATPSEIVADNNSATYSTISVTVVDSDNQAVSNQTVQFRLNSDSQNLGSVQSIGVTNEFGIATARFLDSGVASETGAVVIAKLANTSVEATCRVIISPAPTTHIETLTSSTSYIYSDNNLTTATITAKVKDQDGFAVPNATVRFRTSLGDIAYVSAITDSSGTATTMLLDNNCTPGTATVTAVCGDSQLSTTVEILSTPSIPDDANHFSLIIATTSVAVDQVVEVKALVKNSTGQNVTNGTIVYFSSSNNLGYFQAADGTELGESAMVTTNNGIAKTYFNAGTQAGSTEIVINVISNSNTLERTSSMTIVPGTSRTLEFSYTIPEGGVQVNGDGLNFDTLVKDAYGNHLLAGKNVAYTATSGNVLPSATTNDNGIAANVFSPGNTAGTATITALADSASAGTSIQVVSSEVSYLQFSNTGQISIQVAGTGGNESTPITVMLYDMNGNTVQTTTQVFFQLTHAPSGTNIRSGSQISYNQGTPISTYSANGQAVISLNSGSTSGTVTIKAFTGEVSNPQTIATASNILVVSGPPAHINISLNSTSTGVDMGGGYWKQEVAALVTDVNGNPVQHGSAVWFSITDVAANNYGDIEWCSITPSAYVENANATGDSVAGTAYSSIVYHGIYTNQTPEIWATCGTYTDHKTITLPLQNPQIDYSCIPWHIDWVETQAQMPTIDDVLPHHVYPTGGFTLDGPRYCVIHTVITDGQNTPVNGVLVYYEPSLGVGLTEAPPLGSPNAYGITANVEDQDTGIVQSGCIDKIFRFEQYEAPAPEGGPQPVQVNITMRIVGTATTNTATVELIRYR